MKRIFYFFTILIACVACQNDDSFSTSPGLRLEFSVDTLKLDTVFSRTPSSTYSFWVHNRNDNGIRMQSIRLKRGNQTGYRVNVDGVYLDNSNGSQTNDVEIRRNDSILVFVELTASETRQQDPVLVEDDLIFSMESGAEQKVCLQAWSWDAKKVYDTVISKDSVIDSRVPIIIYGDLKVVEGATLTIKNTSLYFHDGSGLEIYGNLKTENCIMRGDRLDRMFSYLPYDRISGQWKGIRFHESSKENHLVRTVIRNPQNGIVCDSAAIDSTVYRLQLQECVIHNCQGTGLDVKNANILLENCQLTNTLGYCLSVSGGIAEIKYCTIAQFYPFSAERGAAIYITNRQSPLRRLLCDGTIITGYEEDVVMGDYHEGSSFDYIFSNCLLRTPSVVDTLHYQNILWESSNDSVQGKKHFVKIDEENLDYDFHLDSLSTAKGLGCYR